MNLDNALYQGPRLLVPIRLDAMVVDAALLRIERGNWARIRPDFFGMKRSFNQARNRTSLFESEEQLEPAKGIHLQWILPDGLCHGIQEKTGQLPVFPNVPDTWLLTRVWADQNNNLQTFKSWVIQSAHLARVGRHNLEEPQYLQNKDGKVDVSIIGQAIPLESWDGSTPETSADLKAMSHNDPSFNSYTVSNENVFSFVDDLSDIQDSNLENTGINVSYLLSGWYANQQSDPLYQGSYNQKSLLAAFKKYEFNIGGTAGIAKALEAFNTWAGKEPATTASPLMLCHGAIHSISWFGADNNDENKSNSETGKPKVDWENKETIPGLIIGNSSFDVLATFIKDKLEEDPSLSKEKTELAMDFLYALDQQMLEQFVQPNGAELLKSKVFRSWFNSINSGTYWRIVQNKTPETEQEAQALAAKFAEAIKLLKALNQDQAEWDRKRELKVDRLRDLYTAQIAFNTASNAYFNDWQKAADAAKKDVQTYNQALASLGQKIDAAQDQIKTVLGITQQQEAQQPTDFILRQIPKANYWEPQDPVLLVNAAKTAHKYGFHQDLDCRYTGQTISELTVYGAQSPVKVNIPKLPNQQFIPKEVPELIKELILLNPEFSSVLASNAIDEKKVKVQQTMIWNPEKYEGLDIALLTKQAGFKGVRPSFRSFQAFTPPWSPLFMDWAFYFFPDGGTKANHPAGQALKNWELLDDGSFDMSFDTSATPPVVENTQAFQDAHYRVASRSLISSHMPEVLKAKLNTLDTSQMNPVQTDIIQTIGALLDDFDLITQQISGFNELLLQQDIFNPIPGALLFPDEADAGIAAELDEHQFGYPTSIENYYVKYPIRAGFGLPHYVRITDDFGITISPNQVDQPNLEGNQFITASDTAPIPKGVGMDNPAIADSRMVQLPPRLLQPSSLSMEWVDAQQDVKVCQEDQNSPVCGWILPNYLDKSLMVYEADGSLLGEIIIYQRGTRYYANSNALPNGVGTGFDQIQNKHLKSFIDGLLSNNNTPDDNGAAFSALLEEIDKATWVNDPDGSRDKKGLSSLIGRPIALLRARVSLNIQGTPPRVYDPAKPAEFIPTASPDSLKIRSAQFPIFVGADHLPQNGLIGYFQSEDYQTLHVVSQFSNISSTYIKQRSTLSIQANDASMAKEDKRFVYLSLLFDYRGKGHAYSGMQPVFDLQLPERFYQEALAQMEVTFRVGPVLSNPRELRMPIPTDVSGQLSWIYQSGINIWQEDEQIEKEKAWRHNNIGKSLPGASFSGQRSIASEGWLDLKDALEDNN